MDRNKRYVTQITQRDLAELADAANLQAGEGIVIVRNESGIEISIDKQALRTWVRYAAAGRDI